VKYKGSEVSKDSLATKMNNCNVWSKHYR